ncbi:hypothetical protein L21SP5_01707 [Salinivirga cyanobacteriivorans]|uniref:Uncharacterized protein n=1 Tax=Salinivirga cyanobacteriivorans TaxID=1307839 RepID=A0A0S2HZN0_9BACT|nr:hypothetical protein [Salinivirga cyanobacteriivorans]ALO15349.1 hypothetical protein L21SP5_01707 [Salinivirga cyanobacteriivorans]
MKNNQHKIIIDVLLVIWTFLWVYYMAFNWAIFSIELKVNLGFAVISGYPFVFFFILGLLTLIIIKYSYHFAAIKLSSKEKEEHNQKSLLEKDIEILKLKEVLFKMQTKDMSESSTALSALQEKLDNISKQISSDEQTKEPPEKSQGENKEQK